MTMLRIVRARVQPYCLPLCRPWRSARGVITERRGWLVCLETDQGLSGYGDCAPLPEAGTEQPEAAHARLQSALAEMTGGTVTALLAALDRSWQAVPAARCAVETGLVDLLAQQAGVPLARWLNPAAGLEPQVNAVIGIPDAGVAERAALAITQGFAVLKLKAGMADMRDELAALRRLAHSLPSGTRLRLDANGAWDETAARDFIEGLAGVPVESLEEPLAVVDAEALRRLQVLAAFPLALDESLAGAEPERWFEAPAVRRIVLKPAVLGGPLAAYALACRARQAGVECVATTTVDSAAGTWASAHLAAALANELCHGLATGAWLAEDVGKIPHTAEGRLVLDKAMSGLGFSAFPEWR